MRRIACLLFCLWTATSTSRAAYWFVSTNGTGNGSLSSPWQLQTALTNPLVQPGDTIWLRGGTYVPPGTNFWSNNDLGWALNGNYVRGTWGNFVTFASYSNEWAAIDRKWYLEFDSLNGCITFSNLEFFNSLKGLEHTNSLYPKGPWIHFSIQNGTNINFVNCLIHDVNDCMGVGVSSVRGCIFWYVGWDSFEHVFYPAPQSAVGNIVGWPENVVVNFNKADFICSSNIIFAGGGQTVNGSGNDIAVGSHNVTLTYNYHYTRIAQSQAVGVTGGSSVPTTLIMNSNVVMSALPVKYTGSTDTYSTATVLGNTFYASSAGYNNPVNSWSVSTGAWTLDYNNYYSTAPPPATFYYNGTYDVPLAAWRSDTGFDAHSTVSAATLPPNGVYVIPNQDQAKRCHIAIYNFSLQPSVSANLSGVLNAGDTYQLLSAQNYLAGPIQTGTYNGTSISIPMANLTVAPILSGSNVSPLGDIFVTPAPTSPEFGAFIVIGSAPVRPSPPTGLQGTPASH